MGRVTLTLPRLGETMEEAKVLDWLVAPGEAFRRGDVLLEVETDKTVVEVPALADGVLVTPLVEPGETVALGQPIAEVDADGAAGSAGAPPESSAAAPAESVPAAPVKAAAPAGAAAQGRVAASPAARAAARRAGVDLSVVEGSGRRGRVTADDVAGAGRGPQAAVALIHGLFDHSGGWRDLPRRLAATGRQVVALDLPGHAPDAPAVSDLDAAVDAMAKALPPGRVVLIGHSLGAAIATRLALRAPGRVVRLVLIAPFGLGARVDAQFVDGMLAAETPAALARALALLDAGPLSQVAAEQELARLKDHRAGQAALARAMCHRGFQQVDISGDLARLKCPVSVVFGTEDRVLDWRDVANLPSAAAIHLVRGAGHLPHLAAPDLVVRLAVGSAAGLRETAHV